MAVREIYRYGYQKDIGAVKEKGCTCLEEEQNIHANAAMQSRERGN